MYRTALRAARRPLNGSQIAAKLANQRFASTGPASKGTWKGTVVRWGLAGTAVYFYSTSTMFREESASKTIPPPPSFSDDDSKTVEAVIAEKRKQAELKALARKREEEARAEEAEAQSGEAPVDGVPAEGGMETLEGEAESNGAFDPETGEINWDCPCLGGMAHGPCGEEFKAAFSCFVYSQAEPKGIDCVDKFQGMQECFRQHPDVYGAEIDDMDGEDSPAPAEGDQQHTEEGAKQESGSVKPEPEPSKAATSSTEKPKPSKQKSAEEEARQETTDTAKPEPEASKTAPLVEQPKHSKKTSGA